MATVPSSSMLVSLVLASLLAVGNASTADADGPPSASVAVTTTTTLAQRPLTTSDPQLVVAASPLRNPRSVFFIQRNKNRNEVHYGIDLDEQCTPAGSDPLYNYWLRLEEGPEVTEPVKVFQQPAYGFKRQHRDGTRVDASLRALPDRPLTVTVAKNVNGCGAMARMQIGGSEAQLVKAYVFAVDGWLLPRVEYVDLFGLDDDGNEVRERVTPD